MTVSDSARESARQRTGEFGVHSRPDSDVELSDSAAPAIFNLQVRYGGGDTETIVIDSTGNLPAPHRSDTKALVRLVGFSEGWDTFITLHVENAIKRPKFAIGLTPRFETTDGVTTGLLAKVVSISPA